MDTRIRQLRRVLLCASLLIGCHGGAHTREHVEKLDPREALHHAVELANEQCLEQLGAAPFDSASYQARFDGERWRWGSFDVHGIEGYSALVSFDPSGENDSVTVRLNVDVHQRERDTVMERLERRRP